MRKLEDKVRDIVIKDILDYEDKFNVRVDMLPILEMRDKYNSVVFMNKIRDYLWFGEVGYKK